MIAETIGSDARMAEIHHEDSIAMAAPPDEVWRFRIDFSNLGDYNPDVHDLRRTDDGTDPGIGARYEFRLESDYGSTMCTLHVVDAVVGELVVNEMDAGLRAVERCTFTQRADGRTDVTIRLTVTVPDEFDDSVRQLVASVNADQVRAELVNMRAIVERGSQVDGRGTAPSP